MSMFTLTVRNTVVRATIKVNGKPLISGTRSPKTPGPIDLKFDVRDYVRYLTPHAKNCESRPHPRQRGEISCSNVSLFFCDFLRSSGEHIFGSIATVFVSNDMFQWGLIS